MNADITPATPVAEHVRTRLRRASDRLRAHPFQAWFYGDSVGFEGLLAAQVITGDESFTSFAHGFLRAWAARDEPRRADDNTAPGHVLCELAERTGDSELCAAAIRLGEYLATRRRVAGTALTLEDASRLLRTPYGDVQLPVDEQALLERPGAGIYVDCLHFDPPFYAHLARLSGDLAWARRAVEEALGYRDLLADPATGLYYHFWLEQTEQAYALGWGRGQGWALLGLLDVLELVPEDIDRIDEVNLAAGKLIEAMLDTQRGDGSWATMAHQPESGEETSTAAFMATAFWRASRMGIGDAGRLRVAAERAWAATWAATDEDGLLTGVSAAVYSSTQPAHYHHVPRGFDVPWGQGPLLLAAAERATRQAGQGLVG